MEAMGKLIKLKVLLYGLRGTGIETAKNLILAGPNTVTLIDPEITKIEDLGSNFYLKEDHVSKISRAEASLNELKNLNPYVNVNVSNEQITENLLLQYDVVIFTDYYNKKELIKINNFCRSQEKPIGFIFTGILGLFGFTFVDFGNNHTVFDKNGENCVVNLVTHITNEKEGIITCQEDKRHNLRDGDWVTFSEVKGMENVNNNKFQISVISPYTFKIGDTSAFGKYLGEGICTQIKEPFNIHFKSLEEALSDPLGKDMHEMFDPDMDFENLNKPYELHFYLNVILDFYDNYNRLPNYNDLNILKELSAQLLKGKFSNKNIIPNELLFTRICKYSECQISASASFWGGINAQEIVKFTGKYMPIRQWLLYENYSNIFTKELDEANHKVVNNRYMHMIMLFGDDFFQKLSTKNVLMVGCGALGCEYLKIFSLMGMCSAQNSKFTVTDDDSIEVSNLNRQFLFRKEHVGSSKSQIGAKVAKLFNNNFNVIPLKERACPENEKIFTDEFFDNLSFVVNAVDNVKARQYVDEKCVLHKKPLFESGTLGTKCNSQIIIPNKTECYSDSVDPPETGIPLCTLRNYPYLIDHTIEWARDYFQKMFVDGSSDVFNYFSDTKKFIDECERDIKTKQNTNTKEKLDNILSLVAIINEGKLSTEAYVTFARQLFEDIFHNQIALLLHSLPLDHKDENGNLFWRSPKRPPYVLNFDKFDNTHFQFITSTITILKYIFNDNNKISNEDIISIIDNVKLKPFHLKKIKVQTNENDNTPPPKTEDEDVLAFEIIEKLKLFNTGNQKINLVEFEKDDDSNGHIDFISSISNLRARNYKIKEEARHNIKMIAGKIIPAIATTTAMVCGAVTFEIIKVILDTDFSKIRNFFSNLAIPIYVFSEPMPPLVQKDKDYCPIMLGPVKTFPQNWSTWTKLEVTGSLTLLEFNKELKNKYGLNVDMVTLGTAQVWMDGMPNFSKRNNMKMEDIFCELVGKEYLYNGKRYIVFNISATNDNMDDLYLPSVIYKFN